MSTEVGSLQASLSLNISQFSSGMKEAITLTKAFGQQLKQALGTDVTQGFSSMQRTVSEAAQSVEQLRAKMSTLSSSANLNQATKSFAEIQTFTGRVKGSLDNIVSTMRTFSKTSAEAQAQTMRIKGSMDEVLRSAMTFSKSGDSLGNVFNKAQAGMKVLYTLTNMETGEMFELAEKAAFAAKRLAQISSSPVASLFAGAADESQELFRLTDMSSGKVMDLSRSASRAAQELAEAADDAAKLDQYLNKSKKSSSQLAKETKRISDAAEKTNERFRKHTKSLRESYVVATDLKRIIAGIVLSQSFYAILGVMQDLVMGSYTFMNNMDQASIAFKYLLDDASGAETMVTRLQNFAIDSPLDTQQVMKSTRQLMAMGFAAKSVVPTMQVLADTTAVFTDDSANMSEMLDRITVALGQMKASGKVMTQELRQLYNAGVPVFSILQEEMGLTADQVRNIGKLNIDSSAAVIAILKGLQKRYNGAAKEFTREIPGAFQVIHDSLYVMANDLFKGTQEGFKNWLNMIADNVNALMQITRLYGAGGLFQALFPPESWQIFRNLIGAFKELGKVCFWIGQIFKVVFGDIFKIVTTVMSYILPPIAILCNAFAQLAYYVLMNVPGVRLLLSLFGSYILVVMTAKAFMSLFNALKFGAIFGWVAKQVAQLFAAIKALSLLMIANPISLGIMAICAVLAALVWQSERAQASIKRLFTLLSGGNKVLSKDLDLGYDPNEIAQPVFKGNNPDADAFNGTLEDINESFRDMADEAAEADKAIKQTFNQSFDEVYTINPSDGNGDGLANISAIANALSGLEDLLAESADWIPTGEWAADWAELEKIMNLDDLEMENPFNGMDLGEWSKTFWNELVKAIGENPEWVAAAIAAAVTAPILAAIGAPVILAAVAAFAAWCATLFWLELQEEFGLSTGQGVATAITTSFGAILGGALAGMKALLKSIDLGDLKYLWSTIVKEFMEDGIKLGLKNLGVAWKLALEDGALIGALKGGLKGFLKGFIIGAIVDLATGALANIWAAKIKEVFNLSEGSLDNAGIGQTIAGIIGGIIGGIFGGPGGAILGVALGNFVGSIFGVFWERTKTDLEGMGARWEEIFIGNFNLGDGRPIGEKILGLFQGAFAWVLVPLEFLWKGVLKPLVDGIGALFGVELSGPIESFFANLGTTISTWTASTSTAFMGWATGVFQTFTDWCTNVGMGIDTWIANTFLAFTTWCTNVSLAIDTWVANTFLAFTTWCTNVALGLTTWFTNTLSGFTTWFTNVVTGFATFFTTIWTNLTTFLSTALNDITTWLTTTFTNFTTWFTNNSSGFSTFFSDIIGQLGGWIANTVEAIGGWIANTMSAFAGWWAGVLGGFNSWVSGVIGAISDMIGNVWGAITGWLSNLSGTFSSWWENIIGGFYSFGQGIYNAIVGWIDATIGKVQSLIGTVQGAVDAVASSISSMASSWSSAQSSIGSASSFSGGLFAGHARGGVFDREHIANFAEGNKAEAIIPLENSTAMQPFVDAVSRGLLSTLAPMLASRGSSQPQEQQQILYVGTLIADDRSLKELERKMKVIRLTEEKRSG